MPSGTSVIEILNDQIESDSSSSEGEEFDSLINQNESVNDVNTAMETKNDKTVENVQNNFTNK